MEKQSNARSTRAFWLAALAIGSLLVTALILQACNSTTTGSGMGAVSIMLSDPATCQAPNGPFSHVYVTITDVQANVSGTAGDTDSGWVDLTPNLSSTPKQIDLLGQANNQCFLATLGDIQQLQAGSYQQFRIILASNTASVSANACASAGSANCVALSADGSVHTLLLSSESKTGIKIPASQIASGGFSIAAGQTKDLDIDFDTCNSIVQEGNGQYRLKPVLHAGEVSLTSTSINGTVLDSSTGNPINGKVLVALEQKDAAGVDRVQMSTLANADGSFVFCPLPAGTYDMVVVGTLTSGAIYQPSIVTGVAVGSTTGTVKLYPAATTATSSAALSGIVTSQNSAAPPAGTAADLQLSGLETVSSVTYTIPLPPTSTQSSATLPVETAASTTTLTCPTGTDCASYKLSLPSGGPNIGAWTSGGVTLTLSSPLASYVVDAIAFVPGSGNTLDCTPSEMKSSVSALTGAGPYSVAVSNLAFTSCQ